MHRKLGCKRIKYKFIMVHLPPRGRLKNSVEAGEGLAADKKPKANPVARSGSEVGF